MTHISYADCVNLVSENIKTTNNIETLTRAYVEEVNASGIK
jgi:hypothetical protein